MTIAISEILQQVEMLTLAEQQELARELSERVSQKPDAQYSNGAPKENSLPAVPESSEEEGDDVMLDVFSLNRVPPKRTYTMQVSYKFIGRGKPMPYELDEDLLGEEAISEGELR